MWSVEDKTGIIQRAFQKRDKKKQFIILQTSVTNKRRERDLNPRMLAHTGSQGPRPTELGDLCKNC